MSGSDDKTARLWDAVTGALLQTLEGHSFSVFSVAFSPDDRQVVSGSDDKTTRLWDTATGALLQTLKGHSGWVSLVAFSLDGKQVVSGSGDKTVRLWDAVTGALLQILEGYSSSVTSVTFSLDGKLLPTLLVSENWIVEGGIKILWLPPNHRLSYVAVWNRSLVLGNLFGEISIIEFKEGLKFI
jgi:WD40 repeat protein